MTSFARSLLLALAWAALVARPGAAQAEAAVVPAPLADAVAGTIARTWAVDSAAVRLEWGAVPGAAVLDARTPFRLIGRGDQGVYVVLFEPAASSSAAVRVRAGVAAGVPVATRALPQETVLTAGDVALRESVRWGMPGPAAPGSVEGWTTRRPIAAGEPIDGNNASAPMVIKAGDPVRVEWRRGTVSVGLEGVALNSAGMGEPVKVRFQGRGQRSGRAMGPGSVGLGS